MTPLYLFDLDGTLADIAHRRPLVSLQEGSPVTVEDMPGTYRGEHANPKDHPALVDNVWVEFPGTGTWAYHKSNIRFRPDWKRFHAACVYDKPIPHMVALFHRLANSGAEVRIWSGRMSTVRLETIEWLCLHEIVCISDDVHDAPELKMRKAKDYTPDDQLKERWLHALPAEDRARLQMVFDDRTRVVDMWRRNGVPCAQVAPGDF